MKPEPIRLAAAIAALAFCASAASAADPPGPVSTPVGVATTTLSGQPITLPQGPVTVTVTRTDLPAGGVLPIHKHPYPRYAYVISGRLKAVNLDTGLTSELKAGEFTVDPIDQWHKAWAMDGKPASLLVIDQTPPGQGNMVRKAP